MARVFYDRRAVAPLEGIFDDIVGAVVSIVSPPASSPSGSGAPLGPSASAADVQANIAAQQSLIEEQQRAIEERRKAAELAKFAAEKDAADNAALEAKVAREVAAADAAAKAKRFAAVKAAAIAAAAAAQKRLAVAQSRGAYTAGDSWVSGVPNWAVVAGAVGAVGVLVFLVRR